MPWSCYGVAGHQSLEESREREERLDSFNGDHLRASFPAQIVREEVEVSEVCKVFQHGAELCY